MEGHEKDTHKKVGCTNGIIKEIQNGLPELNSNITILDFSCRNIAKFENSMTFPSNIIHLNISHNMLTEVPAAILALNYLKILDLSHNNIMYFDNKPNFCQTIEHLNLSHNNLQGPPYWVWSESPKNLFKLNISFNENLCNSFVNGYLEELLSYTTIIKDIDINNCLLNKHMVLMSTFCNAKIINLGSSDYVYKSLNHIEQLPCVGLDKCCNIERFNLANTNLYTINPNIHIYINLIEINLSSNMIHSLPNEFCNLLQLKICILSYNKLLYLPDEIYKLTELRRLYLDNNELCMLPESLNDLPHLKTLDLYNNNLCEELDINAVKNLDELDLAQNYLEEPCYTEYLMRKDKLRLNNDMKSNFIRFNGRKPEQIHNDSDISSEISDNDLYSSLSNENVNEESPRQTRSQSGTSEDWDSDEHWIPRYYPDTGARQSAWTYFIKQKIAEGNFCPIDAHPVSVTEKVKYEKLCNLQEQYESDGQFDDYSDDNS